MIWLNTYWTFSYVLQLLFVFITLFFVGARWLMDSSRGERSPGLALMLAGVWASLGTFFFHCWW